MKRINDLPLECLSSIAELLDLPDVMSLLATSKRWNLAIKSNEASVYRCLAGKHDSRMGFAPSSRLSEALRSWASPHARSITTWKQYCKAQVATEQRWRGRSTPACTLDVHGPAQTESVKNIRIDLEKSFIVTTETRDLDLSLHMVMEPITCLVVRCLLDPAGPILFSLNTPNPIQQLELSNGYVVCSHSEGFSIWRWAVDQQKDPAACAPTPHQAPDKPTDSIRGQLVSMGEIPRLSNSLFNSLFRFIYPTLCAVGLDCRSIHLWDVPSRSLVQTITTDLHRVKVVPADFTDTHVFIALDNVLVYSRQTGQLVFQLNQACLRRTHYRMIPPIITQHSSDSWFEKYTLSEYLESWEVVQGGHSLSSVLLGHEKMFGVHVSPSGRDFIATTRSGCIIRVEFTSPIPESNISDYSSPTRTNCRVSVTRVHPIRSVAYDGKRIAILGEKGLSILYMSDQPQANDTAQDLFSPLPATSMFHIPLFQASVGSIHRFDGLELMRDMCWFSWRPTSIIRRRQPRVIGVVDLVEGLEAVGDKSEN